MDGGLYLFPTGEEELVGVNSVGDGAPYQREPVEDDWGLVGVLEQELAQDVDEDGEDEESGPPSTQQHPGGLGRALLADTVEDCCEEPHDCTRVLRSTRREEEGCGCCLYGMKLDQKKVNPLQDFNYFSFLGHNHGCWDLRAGTG